MKTQTLSFLTCMALLLSFISCTSNVQELETEQLQLLKQIVMTTEDFEPEADSRTLYQIAEGAVKCSWASNDTVGVFPDKGMQTCFPMTSENGMKNATFDGGGWALKDGSTYGAYYPFIGNMYLDKKSIPVSYKKQTQVGNGSIAHLGTYDYMVATPVAPEFGSAHFTFKHLGVLVQLRLTIPQAATLTSMKLVTEIKAFALEGKVNIMADAPSISPIISDNEIELTLQDISTTEENQVVTLYMMLPPTDLSEQTLKVVVVSNKGTLEYVFGNKNFQAGKAYALTGTIKEQPVGNGTYQNGVVSIAEAGTMKQLLGNDYLNITSLKVVGPINGDDVYYLRKMLGGNDFSQANWGKLTTLDLSEATIVEGGEWYSSQLYNNKISYYYTSDDVIGQYMFYKCANLQNIILPNNITDIKYSAFEYCSSLVSVTIPNGIVGSYAFRSCDSLTTVVFGDGVTKIGDHAFLECSALISLTIGDSVTDIEYNAFTDCSSLVSVTIPNGIIGENAFRSCKALKTVTLGDGVTRIEKLAFYLCSSLETVIIGRSVNFIGENAFYDCTSINSVYITDLHAWLNIDFNSFGSQQGENPLCYGSKLYLNNNELTELIIPEGISVIQRDAFYGCESLVKIDFGKSVTKIDDYAFGGCTSLVSVIIPDNVTELNNAFVNCTSLTSVVIGDGVTKLCGFAGCSSLASIIIGENVTELPSRCFYGVQKLECYCYASTPPTLGSQIFYAPDFNSRTSTLYVPERCGSAYKTSEWGSYFTNIIEMD